MIKLLKNREIKKISPDTKVILVTAYGTVDCAVEAMKEGASDFLLKPLKKDKIIEGNLYLFYNFYFNNTLIDWNKDEHRLKADADTNWHKIINIP